MKVIDTTHKVIDGTKHTMEVIKHTIESKENIIEAFEHTGGQEIHEHRFLHTGEMIFSKVMMLVGG